MEVNINMDYDQILNLIKQLPENQFNKLQKELRRKRRRKLKVNKSKFQDFLLSGPTMTDEQYNAYLENRKLFNQWRKK